MPCITTLPSQEENPGCSDCCSSLKTQFGLHTLHELGKGGQGIVFLCSDQARCVRLACKTIRTHAPQKEQISIANCSKKRKLLAHDVQNQVSSSRRKLSAEEVYQDTQLRWEAEVLRRLSGIPGVLPLVSTFEGDGSCFHLLTEFCDGGDLLGKLDSHAPLFKLAQHEAAPIVASLARTLASCHARGIVHRDIKPGNILFRRVEGTDREDVVLADFGLAATIAPGEILCDRVGTSRYQAPEVIQGHYDHRADIWGLGMVLHLLITSTLPFIEGLPHDAPNSDIQHAILCNELKLEGFGLPCSARDLLKRILCKDPNARITLDEILCHPWLLCNMEPRITAALKLTKSSVAIATSTNLRSPFPTQHAVRSQMVVGLDAGDNVPKNTRVCKPMCRICFRQQWRSAINAKAALV